jgi:hypothetical protein
LEDREAYPTVYVGRRAETRGRPVAVNLRKLRQRALEKFDGFGAG